VFPFERTPHRDKDRNDGATADAWASNFRLEPVNLDSWKTQMNGSEQCGWIYANHFQWLFSVRARQAVSNAAACAHCVRGEVEAFDVVPRRVAGIALRKKLEL
jgi:hypothetical protein